MKEVDSTERRSPGRKGLLLLLLVAGVAGGILLAIELLRPDSATATIAELTREALERDGEVLRIRDDGTIFSGYLVSHYPDGTLRSRSRVVDGRLHGLSEGWYADGTPEIREEFRAGLSHGVRLRWHPNGEMASRAEIEDGQLHGVFRRWREDGTLWQVIHMRHSQPHGISKAYFPSGYLEARTEIERGNVVRQEFWDDGVMSDEGKNPNSASL